MIQLPLLASTGTVHMFTDIYAGKNGKTHIHIKISLKRTIPRNMINCVKNVPPYLSTVGG